AEVDALALEYHRTNLPGIVQHGCELLVMAHFADLSFFLILGPPYFSNRLMTLLFSANLQVNCSPNRALNSSGVRLELMTTTPCSSCTVSMISNRLVFLDSVVFTLSISPR